jgi:hypothetical protein
MSNIPDFHVKIRKKKSPALGGLRWIDSHIATTANYVVSRLFVKLFASSLKLMLYKVNFRNFELLFRALICANFQSVSFIKVLTNKSSIMHTREFNIEPLQLQGEPNDSWKNINNSMMTFTNDSADWKGLLGSWFSPKWDQDKLYSFQNEPSWLWEEFLWLQNEFPDLQNESACL